MDEKMVLELYDKLEVLYKKLGLIKENGKPLKLETDCSKSENCWNNIQKSKHTDDRSWIISRPWIGRNYNSLKILFVGININNHGGYVGPEQLVKLAKKELKRRKKKHFINKENNYKGSLFFHRMSYYTAIIREHYNQVEKSAPGKEYSFETLIESLDSAAYTNFIKCSPVNQERSKPSQQMWEHCGKLILKKELEILAPELIIVFGISENWWNILYKVFDSIEYEGPHNNLRKAVGSVGKEKINLVGFPHPSCPKGCSLSLFDNLRDLLKTIK